MDDRRPPPDVLDVVRTRRVELYDAAGRGEPSLATCQAGWTRASSASA